VSKRSEEYNPPPPPPLQTNGFRFQHVPYITNGTSYVVTLLDEGSVTNAYEIYFATNLQGTSVWDSAWTLAATGAVSVTNFTLPWSSNVTDRYFKAARLEDYDQDGVSDASQWFTNRVDAHQDSDGDGLPDTYETNHGLSPNLFDSDTNGMGDQVFTLSWWIREPTTSNGIDLIVGDGFRVHWDAGILFYLDQQFQDISFTTVDSNEGSCCVAVADHVPDNAWHKWTIQYDYRTLRIFHRISGVDTLVNEQWYDNMTEKIGTSFSTSVITNGGVQMSNVVVQHFQYARKNAYRWDGVIGNTSTEHYGPTMHNPFWPAKKLVLGGSNLFYTCEFDEGNYPLKMFSPSNPQVVLTNFGKKAHNISTSIGDSITNLVVQTNTLFAAGNTFYLYTRVTSTALDLLSNVQYYATGPTGIEHHLIQPTMTNAVISCFAESTGSLHGGLFSNVLYFIRVHDTMNITLHSNALGALSNTARVMLSGNGSGTNSLRCRGLHWTFDITTAAPLGTNNTYFPAEYVPPNLTPSIALTNQLAVSTNLVDGKIAVFDRSSQQVKVYNANGSNVVLTIGTNGGYANGPSVPFPTLGDTNFAKIVKLSGFYDDQNTRTLRAVVCYQPDGKLWVSDTATARLLRFNPDGSLDTFIETVPHSYRSSVDPNHPQRVFAHFLEFHVDHSQPIASSWILTNYWGYDLTSTNGTRSALALGFPYGLETVTTVTNYGGTNRTFAFVLLNEKNGDYRFVELTSTGLVQTLTPVFPNGYQLAADGTVHILTPSGNQRLFQRRAIEFTGSGQAFLATEVTLSTWNNLEDPQAFTWELSGTNFVLFDGSIYTTGYHLGTVSTNAEPSRPWTWRAAPTGEMNGQGRFDPRASNYAGEQLLVTSNAIFFVYRGEFWKGDRQANQIFHYKPDGTFVGQFGLPLWAGGQVRNPPGSANNMHTASALTVGTNLYIFTNDERSRGIHRWRLNP
jgi:hypothetical protein